jgi:putative phage repressor
MKINDLILKIRKENNLTYEEMGNKLDFSHTFISEIEKGRKKVSKKMYEKLIKFFPAYKKEIDRSYAEYLLPSNVDIIKEKFEKPKIFKFPVYGLASAGSGQIDMEHYSEEEFLLPSDFKMPRGAFVMEIHGDSMEPILFNGDKVIVNPNLCPTNIEEWRNLNRKVTIVDIDDKRYAKKVVFKAGKMYLYSFNKDVYPEIAVEEYEDIRCVGVVSELIQRKMTNIQF